jgi:hypothetical protein
LFILISCQEAEISEIKVIELSKIYLESVNSQDFINLVTNYDSPSVEKLDFDDSYIVFYFEENDGEPQGNELKGKKVWKISYSHTLEYLLGSYTIYLDRYSGEIYGVDLMM